MAIAQLLFVTRVDAFGLKEILKGIYIPIHNILGVEGLSLDFQWAYNPGIFPFGVVALVALTPLIAVQLMGVAYRIKMSRVEKRVVPAFDGRDEIVELEEEWA